MKWIGQNIYDQISKFRNTVEFYAEGPDETHVLSIDAGGIDLKANFGISIAGTDILTDSSGTATLSNIDALDATTISTLNAALTAGDITGVTAGTGLSGGGTSGAVTLNVDAAQTQITEVGTIGTGRWQGTAIASAYLDADTAHLSGTQTFTGAKTFSAATTTFTSATADSPLIKVLNTTDDDQASQLIFEKLRDDDAVASGQNLGEIWFKGQDAAQNTEDYAVVYSEIDVSTSGQESGMLKLAVAAHDGGTKTGLQLTGGSEGSEVDVVLGLGANSVVTIPGDIDLAGDIDVDGTLETDALTIGGATIAAIGTTAITTLGTIGTGVWNGTAIATDQQKHLASFRFAGYGTTDGTNYEIPEIMTDTNAPFEHNTSAGADGLTALAVSLLLRCAGQVMPYAGTLKNWIGWAASSGSGTTYVSLFKYTPNASSSSAVSLVLLDEQSFTAAGNNTVVAISQTSFTDADVAVGDIIITGVKGVNNKTMYFTSTLEVEWD